jgi:AcrR family transcriptional regulator
MPKRVDHDERRRHIAAALLRVTSREGLGAVSLRHVAVEAGVTAGMVQHYFPSKGAMMQYAMVAASERYERRITAQLDALGSEPDPRRILRVLLGGLIPTSSEESDDARVALAFQAYAAHDPAAAAHLEESDRLLVGYLADLLDSLVVPERVDSHLAATTLLAAAEGLATATLSAGLSPDVALEALEQQLSLVLGSWPCS